VAPALIVEEVAQDYLIDSRHIESMD